MLGLEGKKVIVTGGSRGIGRATVERFAAEGAAVLLTGRNRQAAEATAHALARKTGGTIYAFPADVSAKADDLATVRFALEKMGGIDVLVNNAGIYYTEPFEEITEERWDEVMAVDLKGTFLMCQAVAPHFKEKKSGAIVNMSSTNGIAGELNYAHYNAAKAGIVLLTKSLALELAPYHVRVNCVCPGYIQTESTDSMDSPEFLAEYARTKIPLGRVGRAEEVASVIAFLASEDASFVTGESVLIDGGQLAF